MTTPTIEELKQKVAINALSKYVYDTVIESVTFGNKSNIQQTIIDIDEKAIKIAESLLTFDSTERRKLILTEFNRLVKRFNFKYDSNYDDLIELYNVSVKRGDKILKQKEDFANSVSSKLEDQINNFDLPKELYQNLAPIVDAIFGKK